MNKAKLLKIIRLFHPKLDVALKELWYSQALNCLKILGSVLILLSIISQIIILSIPTSQEHGTIISLKFIILGVSLLLISFLPFIKKVSRLILLISIFYLIADNIYSQLTLFANHKTQLGLFIASLCFIAFTFMPYRPYIILLFGMFGIFFIIFTCKYLGIVVNPRYNTHIFWLIVQFSGLTLITFFFRSAILNMQLGIYYSTLKLISAKEDLEDITGLLARSEGQHLEFKSSLRWDYHQEKINSNLEIAVLKEIASFLNSEGGAIILGVDDRGNIIGLEKDFLTLKKKDADGFEQVLVQLISQKIGAETCQNIKISFIDVEDKKICLVRIKPFHKPVYVTAHQHESAFFIRTGNLTQQLDTKNAIEYINEHFLSLIFFLLFIEFL
ncbi:MAG: ATP-binding protein [Candidatus Hydrogenedentota bacterium]